MAGGAVVMGTLALPGAEYDQIALRRRCRKEGCRMQPAELDDVALRRFIWRIARTRPGRRPAKITREGCTG